LALALTIPLVLRTATTLEPYPALLFPGGVPVLSITDGKALVYYLVLSARTADGRVERLDERKLIEPMPAHYLSAIVDGRFGQDTNPTQSLKIRRVGTIRIPRHVPTPEQRRAALTWIAGQVREQSPQAAALMWQTLIGRFDLRTGRELSHMTAEEVILDLP
jgi:hypothetical protein